jgi:hypothetical protein
LSLYYLPTVILFCFYYEVTQFATRREEEEDEEDGDQVGWCQRNVTRELIKGSKFDHCVWFFQR